MNDKTLAVLEKYDIEVLRSWKGRSAILCETKTGIKILKEYKGSEKRLSLQKKILEEKNCLSLKDLALDGKDLIALGMKPGKELGETLQILFDYVLENPDKNTKEELEAYLQKIRS